MPSVCGCHADDVARRHRFEAQPDPGPRQVRSYRNWNPPLLGNLPDDFLRILPQQLDSMQVPAPAAFNRASPVAVDVAFIACFCSVT